MAAATVLDSEAKTLPAPFELVLPVGEAASDEPLEVPEVLPVDCAAGKVEVTTAAVEEGVKLAVPASTVMYIPYRYM